MFRRTQAMRALTTTAVIGADHTLTARVPPDITPGPKTVVIVLDELPAAENSESAVHAVFRRAG